MAAEEGSLNEGSWLPAPTGAPLAKRAAWNGWLLSPLLVVSIAFIFACAWANPGDILGLLFVYACGAGGSVIYGMVFMAERRLNELAIRPEEEAMLYELGVREGILASMWVLQGRAVTGQDRGTVWVEEGRLMFCGKRTSFVIARDDVEGHLLMPGGGPGKIEMHLRRETPAGPMAVVFTTLIGDRPFATPLDLTILRWLDGAALGGESQWPPTALAPDAETPKAVRRRLTIRGLFGLSILGLLFFPFAVVFGLWLHLLGIFVAGFIVVLYLVRNRPALRDRLRLEEE